MDAKFSTFSAILLAYLFIAGLEEGVKHFAVYSYKRNAFELRKEIALLTVFAALGFVFLENVYYLVHLANDQGIFSGAYFGTLVSRSIVSLLLHVFAALVLALGFAKLLEKISFPTFFRFLSAFFVAVALHALFDVSLTYGKMGIIGLYAFIGYFFLTKAFYDERRPS